MYSFLVNNISELKIVEITKKIVNVGRDDSEWLYLYLYNFKSLLFKRLITKSLLSNNIQFDSGEYYITVFVQHERRTVDRTETTFDFSVSKHLKFKLHLLELVFPHFSGYSFNEQDREIDFHFGRILPDLLSINYTEILSLQGRRLLCHFVENLTSAELENEEVIISEQQLPLVTDVFLKADDFDPLIQNIKTYFEHRKLERTITVLKSENVQLDEPALRIREKEFYKIRQAGKALPKFSFTKAVYVLGKNAKPCRVGRIIGYNESSQKYIVAFPYSINIPWREEIDDKHLVGVWEYDSLKDEEYKMH